MATQQDPKVGDLIEVFRASYQHWAVYVGYGYVIHLTKNDDAGSGLFSYLWYDDKAIVREQRLTDVVGSDKWRVNNLLDNDYIPRSPSEIAKAAAGKVDKKMHYSLTQWNCEHFVTDLRYGKAKSRQVQQKTEQVGALAAGVAIFGLLGAAASALSGGREEEKKADCQNYYYQYQQPYYHNSYYYYY